ncbi:hypothetical protein KBY70_05955 [Cyanobium sp. ATX 6E8]|uniref:hypothetical protein n=1 Tax=Cyanobium sp. ATX 6E8 TaxID=2823701 RepID=UPI0020CDCA3E|nr:hypothetical protein [Cyanobium sp. ATX 6E8]MCP9941930.1 hypothetical protein [Cyanobium sp. ATX 6E8]
MTAFTYERDLDHPVAAEVEQTIRDVLEGHLTSQGLEGVLVNPGLDHDGDPVLFVHLKFRLVEPGIDLNTLSQSTLAVRRALWAIGERRFPHLRYDFHDDQRMIGTEHW